MIRVRESEIRGGRDVASEEVPTHCDRDRDASVPKFAKCYRAAPAKSRCGTSSAGPKPAEKMVRPTGVEPVASRLEVSCSIQLSYGRIRISADFGSF